MADDEMRMTFQEFLADQKGNLINYAWEDVAEAMGYGSLPQKVIEMLEQSFRIGAAYMCRILVNASLLDEGEDLYCAVLEEVEDDAVKLRALLEKRKREGEKAKMRRRGNGRDRGA
jgi:hypothetical protein